MSNLSGRIERRTTNHTRFWGICMLLLHLNPCYRRPDVLLHGHELSTEN